MTTSDAKQSATFSIGGALKVNRLGFGAKLFIISEHID